MAGRLALRSGSGAPGRETSARDRLPAGGVGYREPSGVRCGCRHMLSGGCLRGSTMLGSVRCLAAPTVHGPGVVVTGPGRVDHSPPRSNPGGAAHRCELRQPVSGTTMAVSGTTRAANGICTGGGGASLPGRKARYGRSQRSGVVGIACLPPHLRRCCGPVRFPSDAPTRNGTPSYLPSSPPSTVPAWWWPAPVISPESLPPIQGSLASRPGGGLSPRMVVAV